MSTIVLPEDEYNSSDSVFQYIPNNHKFRYGLLLIIIDRRRPVINARRLKPDALPRTKGSRALFISRSYKNSLSVDEYSDIATSLCLYKHEHCIVARLGLGSA